MELENCRNRLKLKSLSASKEEKKKKNIKWWSEARKKIFYSKRSRRYIHVFIIKLILIRCCTYNVRYMIFFSNIFTYIEFILFSSMKWYYKQKIWKKEAYLYVVKYFEEKKNRNSACGLWHPQVRSKCEFETNEHFHRWMCALHAAFYYPTWNSSNAMQLYF